MESARDKLYAALAAHANERGIVQNVPIRKLVREAGISRDTFYNVLEELLEADEVIMSTQRGSRAHIYGLNALYPGEEQVAN